MKTLLHFKDIGEWTRAEKSVSARTVFFDISTCHFFAAGEPHALFTTSDLFTEEDCSLFDGFAASDMDALDHGHILRVPPWVSADCGHSLLLPPPTPATAAHRHLRRAVPRPLCGGLGGRSGHRPAVAHIQKEGGIPMSTFSQHTADWWAGDSPGITSICFSGGTEFAGKLSASRSPGPPSHCACKGGPRLPPLPDWALEASLS